MTDILKYRDVNIIDILRIFACFAIVWFHIGYYWDLSTDILIYVDTLNIFLCTFAMPFFYITASYFAIDSINRKKEIKSILSRLKNLWIIIFTYTLVYELPKLIFKFLDKNYQYYPFSIDVSGYLNIIYSLFNTFKSVNNSPVYFIFNVFVIYCLAFLVFKIYEILKKNNYTILIFLAGCFLMIVFAYENKFDFFISKNILETILLSFTYYFVSMNIKWKKINLNSFQLLTLISGTIISFGAVVIFKIEPYYFALIFLLYKDIFTINKENAFLTRLSNWGQKYSFGVFAWHFFFLMFLSYLFPKIWSSIGFSNPSLFLYIIIGLVGFCLAVFLTHILSKNYLLKRLFLLN